MAEQTVIVYYDEGVDRETEQEMKNELQEYITENWDDVQIDSVKRVYLGTPHEIVLNLTYNEVEASKQDLSYELSLADFVHNTQLK